MQEFRIFVHLNNKVIAKRRNNYNRNARKEEPYKVNDKIYAKEVRIVGDDVESQVMSINDALKLAKEMELDLVEISPKAVPPVCKVIDYSKFKYEQKKKEKEIKAKSKKVVVKEVRFGPNTDEHDFNFKLKHAISFLESGSKVKAWVQFRGRTIMFKERGEVLLLKFAEALAEYGKIEQLPRLEGRRMSIFVSPKK